MGFELTIRHGLVVDGSGSEPVQADVGIYGDRIVAVEPTLPAGTRDLGAHGMMVVPGFIDAHSHSDVLVIDAAAIYPKVAQGITTEIVAQDGLSYFPVTGEAAPDVQLYLSGLNGQRPNLVFGWETLDDYFAWLNNRIPLNLAALAPHGTIRVKNMGWSSRMPDETEMEKMLQDVASLMEQGALGLSTALTYAPCAYSLTGEVIALCRPVGQRGGLYVTHLRADLGDRLLDPLREAVLIARASGARLHVSHLGLAPEYPGQAGEVIAFIEMAIRQGVDVSFDAYPYISGSGSINSLFPYWLWESGPEAAVSRLREDSWRARVVRWFVGRSVPWQNVQLAHAGAASYEAFEGETLAQIARRLDRPAEEVACDLATSSELGASIVVTGRVQDDVDTFMTHPSGMVGSDGLLQGRAVHPRTYGTFLRFFQRYVRETKRLTWAQAVHKAATMPAERFGLTRRGQLRPGWFADVVVLDPVVIAEPGTDRWPRQAPQGILYVIVNGQVVCERGRLTGHVPGRVLRRGRGSEPVREGGDQP